MIRTQGLDHMLNMSRFFVLLSITVFSCHTAYAQASQASEVLRSAKELIESLCTKVPIDGSNESIEATGRVNAAVNKILKVLPGGEIDGNLQYKQSTYRGVLQHDLADAIKNENDCRTKGLGSILELLKSLPQKSSAVDKPADGRIEIKIAQRDDERIVFSLRNSGEKVIFLEKSEVVFSHPVNYMIKEAPSSFINPKPTSPIKISVSKIIKQDITVNHDPKKMKSGIYFLDNTSGPARLLDLSCNEISDNYPCEIPPGKRVTVTVNLAPSGVDMIYGYNVIEIGVLRDLKDKGFLTLCAEWNGDLRNCSEKVSF